MQPSTSIMALAGLASMASALASRDFVFPVTVPIAKRQAPGSPQYACHEDCGYTIQTATGDYCDSPDWNELFEGCMDCALEFDIWRYYQDGVTEAAEPCGLQAIPDLAGGDDEEEEAPPTTTSEVAVTTTAETVTEVPETTTEVVTTTAEEASTSTSVVVETTTAVETASSTSDIATVTTEVVSETTWSTTLTSTWTTSNDSTATTTSNAPNATVTQPPPGSSASRAWVSLSLVGGAVLVIAINMI